MVEGEERRGGIEALQLLHHTIEFALLNRQQCFL
jgi:hypothetical protein